MSAINAETRDAWQALADMLGPQRPVPGRRVCVRGGRKHKGKSGTVVRHMPSRYRSDRYMSEASLHMRDMRDMRGKDGFVVLVESDDGGERFWVNAEHVEVTP